MIEKPRTGRRVRVTKLGDTRSMLIAWRHLEVRTEGVVGTLGSWVPGHGGDVWWVEHDDSEDVGAYCTDELVELVRAVRVKTFDLETILTVTTGTMLVNDIGKLYEILNYMTGDNLFTHQLPVAAGICKHALWAQYPCMRNLDTKGVSRDNWLEYVHNERYLLGNYFQVHPLQDWEPRDAIQDAVRLAGADKVLVVATP